MVLMRAHHAVHDRLVLWPAAHHLDREVTIVAPALTKRDVYVRRGCLFNNWASLLRRSLIGLRSLTAFLLSVSYRRT